MHSGKNAADGKGRIDCGKRGKNGKYEMWENHNGCVDGKPE